MAGLTYRCPYTGYRVQWLAEEVSQEAEIYQPVNCIVCQQIHYVTVMLQLAECSAKATIEGASPQRCPGSYRCARRGYARDVCVVRQMSAFRGIRCLSSGRRAWAMTFGPGGG